MLQIAPPCLSRPNGMGGDECSDFKNPIGRTFLSGNRIFAETGKSRLSPLPLYMFLKRDYLSEFEKFNLYFTLSYQKTC
jgi:hypothetical protein